MDKNFITKIQERLLKKQKSVEEEIQSVKADDPVLADALPESSESGTDSWTTDAHTILSTMRINSEAVLVRIKKALANLNSGKYGKCDNCGKQIETERLEAMPEATICISCSKKKSR